MFATTFKSDPETEFKSYAVIPADGSVYPRAEIWVEPASDDRIATPVVEFMGLSANVLPHSVVKEFFSRIDAAARALTEHYDEDTLLESKLAEWNQPEDQGRL